ncbi:putative acyltransferase YihG [compost metagenome]
MVYPGSRAPGFWALVSGQLEKVIVDIRPHELDPALWAGDYQRDGEFRQRVQGWVSGLWQAKDARIAELKRQL